MGMGGGNGGSGETVYRSLARAVSDVVGHGATVGALWALRTWWWMWAAVCGRGIVARAQRGAWCGMCAHARVLDELDLVTRAAIVGRGVYTSRADVRLRYGRAVGARAKRARSGWCRRGLRAVVCARSICMRVEHRGIALLAAAVILDGVYG